MRVRFQQTAAALVAASALLAAQTAAVAAAGAPSADHRRAAGHAVAGAAPRTVTLLTGDRVTVYGTDLARQKISPGPGREKITFRVVRAAGRLRVVPSDAVTLLSRGLLDGRLFDVVTLLESGYDRGDDLPLIVTYAGDATGAKARTRTAAAGTRVVRALPGGHNFAVRAAKPHATTFWNRLTGGGRDARLADGVTKVWLDGMRRPTLATSVPQIGAPAAWRAGYTGAGVTVAVLDTGVDGGHGDLAGRVAAARNFTEGHEDDRDLVGHGTHVAATVAGSGSASGGRHRGVAPDARLVNGKVCVVQGCAESWILAGMHWAVAEQRAKIVNLSLGGPDGPAVDPLEQAVADLSEQYGALFVVAAGNEGADATVGSPASAAAALAVGAVDADDALADFSSRGPLAGDLAVKPDVTAPGVGITAARGADSGLGSPGDTHVSLSGTSMAAPHVAGAAALLAQQHPDWPGERIKATLMAAADRATGIKVFGQGAGRLDAARAIGQQVTAAPASLALGMQTWPHDDDQPVTRKVTYHNSGRAPVELTLAVQATGPGGRPAPAGMFVTADSRLTVPAGGSAQTTVTADSRLDTSAGAFAGYLVATSGDLVVNTPLSAGNEGERYDLTLVHTGRDGAASTEHYPMIVKTDGESRWVDVPADGRLRLPRGEYMVSTTIYGPGGDVTDLAWPRLKLTGDQTVDLDARLGKPLRVTVPHPSARSFLAETVVNIPTDDGLGISLLAWADSFDGRYSAQLGPQVALDGMTTRIGSQWARVDAGGSTVNSPYAYRLAWFARGRMPTGFTRRVRPADLATVRTSYASTTPGAAGAQAAFARNDDVPSGGFVEDVEFALPATRVEHYTAEPGVIWENNVGERHGALDVPVNQLWGAGHYRPGRTYRESWNRGVLGPAFSGVRTPDRRPEEVARTDDTINVYLPLHSAAADRFSWSELATGTTSLYRDGTLLARQPRLYGTFAVPPEEAGYRLRIEAHRDEPADLATRTTVDWTFRSGGSPGRTTRLPVSVVRFTPALNDHNAAPAGVTVQVPVQVHRQPDSTGGPVRALAVDVSYDDGKTWRRSEVARVGDRGLVTLRHPEQAGYVSLRAAATDSAGNTVEQTVIRAYRLAPAPQAGH